MKHLKLSKLVGIPEAKFVELLQSDLIQYRSARLIPLLKTGDEMALTSILLSAIRLVKEFRHLIFKELGLPKVGTFHFLTEVSFPEIGKERFDGLIVVIKSGKVVDALALEMKKGTEELTTDKMQVYQDLARKLKIPKLVSVSNQFVSDSKQLPYPIKRYKAVDLYHFSWTYLLTLGRILLFKNQLNIADQDQVEIMKEVLYYFEGDKSGVQSLMRMPSEWKALTEDIRAHKSISIKGPNEIKAVEGWYQMEKHLALKLSQKLGVLVKTKSRSKDSVKADVQFVDKQNSIRTKLVVAHAISDIVVEADFEKRNLKQTVSLTIPESGTNTAKVNWLIKQLQGAKKKKPGEFDALYDSVFVEAYIKYQRKPVTVRVSQVEDLKKIHKSDELKSFKLYAVKDLGAKFTSQTGFLKSVEAFVNTFYGGYIQHLKNWSKPAPKIDPKKTNIEMGGKDIQGVALVD
ncbi:MAG: hypothetical protein AAF433_09235 [Bacteroidota bacterium]